MKFLADMGISTMSLTPAASSWDGEERGPYTSWLLITAIKTIQSSLQCMSQTRTGGSRISRRGDDHEVCDLQARRD